MKSVKRFFTERLVALACDADAVHSSALAASFRSLPTSFFVRRAKAMEEEKNPLK